MPPDAESIRTVSLDTGISDQTIRNWLAKFNQGIIGEGAPLGPRQPGTTEKFNLLLEASALNGRSINT